MTGVLVTVVSRDYGNMIVRVLTSCTGKKRYSPDNQLALTDFRLIHDSSSFLQLERRLAAYSTEAVEMYTGQQHVRLMNGVRHFQEVRPEHKVDLWILSAGYGVIAGRRKICPYECTFRGMKQREIHEWAQHLRIPQKTHRIFSKESDLFIVLLGETYLRSLELNADVEFAAPTIFVASQNSARYIKGRGNIRVVTLKKSDTRRFSCGMVGLKGEVVRRILYFLAENGSALSMTTFIQSDLLRLADETVIG